MELKFKFKYMHGGRETDLVGKKVEVVKVKNKDTAPSKLKKEIRGQLTKIKTYKSKAAIKKLLKIYKELKKVESLVLIQI